MSVKIKYVDKYTEAKAAAEKAKVIGEDGQTEDGEEKEAEVKQDTTEDAAKE